METTVLYTHIGENTMRCHDIFTFIYNINVKECGRARAHARTLSAIREFNFSMYTVINIRCLLCLGTNVKRAKYRWKTQPIFFSLFFLDCRLPHRCGCIKLCQHQKRNNKIIRDNFICSYFCPSLAHLLWQVWMPFTVCSLPQTVSCSAY